MGWLLSVLSSGAMAAAILGVGAFLAREYIRNFVAVKVQHDFKVELSKLESKLRARENEIDQVRQTALSSISSSQSPLTLRRIQAADELWASVTDWGKLHLTVLFAGAQTVNEAIEQIARDSKAKAMYETIAISSEQVKAIRSPNSAQPYVSDLAFAIFSVYVMIFGVAIAKTNAIRLGMRERDGRKIDASLSEALRSLLPAESKLIETSEKIGHYPMIAFLQNKILAELRRTISGKDQDAESADRVAEATKRVRAIRDQIERDDPGLAGVV